MDKENRFTRLYPFQDVVLKIVNDLKTGFYLTGGTALSRGYLHHRLSDDLDFFVNDDPRFDLWSGRIIHAVGTHPEWKVTVLQREERFIRFSLDREEIFLKVDLVNDVPSHIGRVRSHELLGTLDSPENILANKITAVIDRQEPKDLADIWGLCLKMNLSLIRAVTDAESKAAGIFPADLARVLCSASRPDWEVVLWTDPPDPDQFQRDLQTLGEQLLFNEE